MLKQTQKVNIHEPLNWQDAGTCNPLKINMKFNNSLWFCLCVDCLKWKRQPHTTRLLSEQDISDCAWRRVVKGRKSDSVWQTNALQDIRIEHRSWGGFLAKAWSDILFCVWSCHTQSDFLPSCFVAPSVAKRCIEALNWLCCLWVHLLL